MERDFMLEEREDSFINVYVPYYFITITFDSMCFVEHLFGLTVISSFLIS
jgi:hypothetical protein